MNLHMSRKRVFAIERALASWAFVSGLPPTETLCCTHGLIAMNELTRTITRERTGSFGEQLLSLATPGVEKSMELPRLPQRGAWLSFRLVNGNSAVLVLMDESRVEGLGVRGGLRSSDSLCLRATLPQNDTKVSIVQRRSGACNSCKFVSCAPCDCQNHPASKPRNI